MAANQRTLVRITTYERCDGCVDVRVVYLDDFSEDRGTFSGRATAEGWLHRAIEQHFTHGVPGRLGWSE